MPLLSPCSLFSRYIKNFAVALFVSLQRDLTTCCGALMSISISLSEHVEVDCTYQCIAVLSLLWHPSCSCIKEIRLGDLPTHLQTCRRPLVSMQRRVDMVVSCVQQLPWRNGVQTSLRYPCPSSRSYYWSSCLLLSLCFRSSAWDYGAWMTTCTPHLAEC